MALFIKEEPTGDYESENTSNLDISLVCKDEVKIECSPDLEYVDIPLVTNSRSLQLDKGSGGVTSPELTSGSCDNTGVTTTIANGDIYSGRFKHLPTSLPYECPYAGCTSAFPIKSTLRTHTRVHTGEKPFQCDYSGCGAEFSQLGNLKVHLRTHTGEKPYICDYCSRAFATVDHVRRHMRSHTGDKPYKCEYGDCTSAFTSMAALSNHHRLHTGQKPKKRGTSKLMKHMKTHTEAEALVCNFTGHAAATRKSRGLTNHRREHWREPKLEYPYPSCIDEHTADNHSEMDEVLMQGEVRVTEITSEPEFLQEYMDADALNTINERVINRPYPCPHCEAALTSAGSLVVHIRTHTGEKPYKCTHPGCKAAFTQSFNLKIHFRTHTGEKPITCSFPGCTRVFANQSGYMAHLNSHTGKKPFKCKHIGCEVSFAKNGSLKAHVQSIHSGVK